MPPTMFRFSQEAKASLVCHDNPRLNDLIYLFTRAGAGLWMPDAQPLGLLRTNIDRKSQKLKRVLMEPQMRKQILGAASDERKAIKAFVAQNSENALKTKPKVSQSLPFFAPCARGWLGYGSDLSVGTSASSKSVHRLLVLPAIKQGIPLRRQLPSVASSTKSMKAYVRIWLKEARLLISVSATGIP